MKPVPTLRPDEAELILELLRSELADLRESPCRGTRATWDEDGGCSCGRCSRYDTALLAEETIECQLGATRRERLNEEAEAHEQRMQGSAPRAGEEAA